MLIGISVEERDLISHTVLAEITAETAATFHNRVPQYLFKVLQDSYSELNLKLVIQQNAVSQQGARMAGTAFGNEVLPHTPPDSPLEETDCDVSFYYGPDTEAVAEDDWCKDTNRVENRASKLKAQLLEVERERNAVSQRLRENASKIKKEMQGMALEGRAVDKRRTDILGAMQKRRLVQDRTGDYGPEAVGYDVCEDPDLYVAKQDHTARAVILKIENQATCLPKS
ncbi:hypothetical protein HO173_009511 [Letharia columbiana]|uniref:Uncharacterized protein n=1 Tax=Letharia columbiana TaxID=112416 RepID=A0A8H6FPM6_9LECA|nr:uncharacterized protein HO173_009511 [Letharia columbiana]KAF6232406.1 hypothetical protein HO173_009511 [Letharia columbiana]